ncbi:MAG: FecR family protein, partial [Bdellovibrionota bacterium]
MLALSFLSLSYVASAAQPAGKLVSSTGQVQATDPSKISRTLKVGDAVFAGEALKSDPSAAAKFLMTDQTILDLNPGSELLVDYYDLRSGGDRVVQISVNQGKIRASVNKAISGAGSFKIKTHTMVMGVRGTEFVVQDSSRGN